MLKITRNDVQVGLLMTLDPFLQGQALKNLDKQIPRILNFISQLIDRDLSNFRLNHPAKKNLFNTYRSLFCFALSALYYANKEWLIDFIDSDFETLINFYSTPNEETNKKIRRQAEKIKSLSNYFFRLIQALSEEYLHRGSKCKNFIWPLLTMMIEKVEAEDKIIEEMCKEKQG